MIDISFEVVFKEFQAPVLKYLSHMVPPDEAEELCQEVFEKISRNLETFQGRSKISTWVYKIATNTALDRLRKHKKQILKTFEDPEQTKKDKVEFPVHNKSTGAPLLEVISSEMNDCIREQVDKLPDKYRLVMVLSSLKDLDHQEISQILDISSNTVKTRLHRGRAMLKKILEQQCRFYNHPVTGNLSCDRK